MSTETDSLDELLPDADTDVQFYDPSEELEVIVLISPPRPRRQEVRLVVDLTPAVIEDPNRTEFNLEMLSEPRYETLKLGVVHDRTKRTVLKRFKFKEKEHLRTFFREPAWVRPALIRQTDLGIEMQHIANHQPIHEYLQQNPNQTAVTNMFRLIKRMLESMHFYYNDLRNPTNVLVQERAHHQVHVVFIDGGKPVEMPPAERYTNWASWNHPLVKQRGKFLTTKGLT